MPYALHDMLRARWFALTWLCCSMACSLEPRAAGQSCQRSTQCEPGLACVRERCSQDLSRVAATNTIPVLSGGVGAAGGGGASGGGGAGAVADGGEAETAGAGGGGGAGRAADGGEAEPAGASGGEAEAGAAGS